MKKIGLIIGFFLCANALHATHQKAAEITFRHISGHTYHFTLVTYTYTKSDADRPALLINWGYPNALEELYRISQIVYPEDETKENRYEATHTFPGNGTYFISMEDPNRNGGVTNLPNSINTPIYIETKLVINPFMVSVPNSSPKLLNKPIDKGCLGLPFMHNPGAVDEDGDSLAYRLVSCRGTEGTEIPGYVFPDASKSLEINPITGDLIWDSPISQGEFNIAILIEEYRDGENIGSIVRDMQITIQSCQNKPPELHVPEEFCVVTGDTLVIPFSATDPDSLDILELSATSGILEAVQKTGISPLSDTLIWMPNHSHVQQQPYPVYLRAKDNGTPNLNTLKTLLINVVGQAPKWNSLTSNYNDLTLKWEPIENDQILGYQIYRSPEKTGILQDSCSCGISDSAYTRLAELRNNSDSVFVDRTVMQQKKYCYRIVATYKNGMASQMSNEICSSLLSNTPILERTSVSKTESFDGQIALAWRNPLDFDVSATPFPSYYVIHRSLGAAAFTAIDTISDTTYLDSHLNTTENYYHYQIELIQKGSDTTMSIGFSNEAVSIFAHATGRNRRVNVQWYCDHPWKTNGFGVFRKKSHQLDFDSIGFTDQTYFTDTTVINDTSYTYKIKAFGQHYDDRIEDYVLINWSQETSAIPQIDTPCKQELRLLNRICRPAENQLIWEPFDENCYDEDLTFRIFYSIDTNTTPFQEIGTKENENQFTHTKMQVNAGCYYVTASNIKNLTRTSNTVCVNVQDCLKYELPNVFTPNDDGFNDVFRALVNDYSGPFLIKIYNRWGNLVFDSNNSDFQWDGKNRTTQKPCAEGTYFYVVDLLIHVDTSAKETISGTVTLLR